MVAVDIQAIPKGVKLAGCVECGRRHFIQTTPRNPSTNQPTYQDPGRCSKCDEPGPHLEFHSAGSVTDFGRPLISEIGYVVARCSRCGYRWGVLAKDEMQDV